MQKLRKALLDNYNIVAKDIERIEYGLWEKNYKVTTEDTTYFVKHFWGTWRLEERYDVMLRGIRLGQTLREKGIPAPVHINDRFGEPLSKHGDDTFQVNAFIEGITYRPGSIPNEVAYSMGQLLGKLHLTMNDTFEEGVLKTLDISAAIEDKKSLIETYHAVSFDGKSEIVKTLKKQLIFLETEKNSVQNQLYSKVGKVYNSYWIEQLIFDEAHKVKALIDWTDGAGGMGNLADDIDTAFFVSAFDLKGIKYFAKGYQSEHPLSRKEWESILEYSCMRHLNTNWIYHSWYNQTNHRFEHWKTIARKWITGIEFRYLNRDLIRETVLNELMML